MTTMIFEKEKEYICRGIFV